MKTTASTRTRKDQDLVNDLRLSKPEAEAAFTELYSRYSQRTYAYILRITGNAIASQDILQEVFFKFYKAASQDLGIANPGGFIMMIARNLCLNWRRDQRDSVPIEELEMPGEDRNFEKEELLHLINVSLELLDTDYREAFVLKYYQGYSYEEMSALTGETVNALKNRVWRAKEQIKRSLKSYIVETQA